MTDAPTLQEALCKAALDAGAIPKDDVNAQQGFKFRGIDRIMANLGPAMSRNGIVPMPKVVKAERETMERGGKGAIWRLVTLTVEYEFTGPAGDKLTAIVMGEGLDNADKATSKAFTMAEKTCYLQVFKIGDGSTDPDGETPPEQQTPSRRAFLPAEVVAKVKAGCERDGITSTEMAEMVKEATGGRTAVVAEVYEDEYQALKDAKRTIMERKAQAIEEMGWVDESDARSIDRSESDLPDGDDAWWLAIAPKVRALVDKTDTTKPTAKQYRDLVTGLKALGVEEDDDQRHKLSLLLGYTVRSRKNLSASEVNAVVAVLDEEGAG